MNIFSIDKNKYKKAITAFDYVIALKIFDY